MAKRGLSMLLAAVTLFSLCVPAFAESEPVTTEVPVEVTEEPAVTEEPVEVPEAPVEVTEAPVEVTEEPVEVTEEPVEVTEEPVEVTEEPVEVTEEPVEVTEAPVEVTEAPVEVTEAPVEVTEEPVEVTEEPVVVTEEPVVVTEEPVVTEVPVVTEEPVEVTEAPVEVTEAPAEVTEAPEATEEPEIVAQEMPVTVEDSGSCGDGLTWAVTDGVLTITGNGPMQEFGFSGAPWPTSITSVVIGAGVTSIGSYAFYDCYALTSMTIPDSVTSIGAHAFEECGSLASVAIPNGVTSIGVWAFAYCFDLASVTIPSGMTSIEENTFWNCQGLTRVTIPDSVTSIGGGAFFACSSLKSVTIPESVTSMGERAFQGCSSLTGVTIPSGVTTIKSSAFSGCSSLTSVTVPGNVTTIDFAAFSDCTSLTDLTFEDGLTSIGLMAFQRCTSLKNVTIPATVSTVARAAFYDCTALTSVTFGRGVRSIGMEACQGCTALASVTILNPYCDIFDNQHTLGELGTLVIHGYDNSTAQLYAEKYNCTFQIIEPEPTASPAPTAAPDPEPTAPSKPAELAAPTVKVSVASNGIKVSWNKVSGSPRYMVYYRENGGGWKKIGTTAKTSYTRAASKLKSGVNYQFTVRCCQDDGQTMLSAYKASNKLKYYAAPTVKIAVASTGIKVSWSKVSGVSQYMVYYRENGGGWKKIGTTTKTSYTRAASKLKSGVTYQFTVRCCAADKKTILSPFTASNKLKYYAAPTVKIANAANGIKVTWNKVTGASKYTVYYKVKGAKNWTKIGTTTKTSYTWKKAASGKTYYFAVRCANAKGTNISAYKASGALTYVAAPTVKIANAANGIKVTWNKVTGASKYTVYYKVKGAKSWTKIGTTSKTSYTWKKAASGKTYYFTVRCANAKGTNISAYKASSALTYLAAPMVKAAKASNGIKISWGKVSGATKYRIYYKVGNAKSWTKLKDVTKTSYTWKSPKNGVKYTFTVRAYKGSTTSAYDTTGKSITYRK